jgi:RNA polymerase sigma-70 factor (ECF subfamily)
VPDRNDINIITEYSDIELITRLNKGDIKAFDLIYSKYAANLYRFALKYLRSEDEARELVQSVFVKIWDLRRTIKTDTSFRSFIFTIAYNDMCKLFRKRKYNKEFVNEILYLNQPTSETEQRIDYKSLTDSLEKIIEKLPEKQKTIFIKSRYEGKSTREIAEDVGLSPGTVDNYISASINFIKSKLKFIADDFNL